MQGDRLQLVNLFYNLFDNAVKYSPGRPEISVKSSISGNNIMVEVSDKGIGIGKETQQKVFEKFYRVPTGNMHNIKGFGLGLSHVKSIALAHGGTVLLKSEAGKGSTFTISLPIDEEI